METKVKIKSAVDNGKIILVDLEDGRQVKAFDQKVKEFIGQEIPVKLVEGKEFKGKKDLILNLIEDKKKFPQKDWSFEKKRVALETARVTCQPNDTPEQVIASANKYLTWLQ